MGVTLDSKLTFNETLHNVSNEVNKTIYLFHKLQSFLSRKVLISICNAFVRPYLYYGDTLHDQGNHLIFGFMKD